MPPLIRIGYWHNEAEPGWPDPGRFVDPHWPAEKRARVAAYLRAGSTVAVAGGASWCRFHCKGHGAWGVGNGLMSDGRYIWPDGLVHYVERHFVRLPDRFLDAMSLPALQIASPLEARSTVDDDWWRAQPGFGSVQPTHLSPARKGDLFAIPRIRDASTAMLRLLRRASPLLNARSVSELRAAVAAGERLPVLRDVYEADVADLRAELETHELSTTFEHSSGGGS